MYTSTHSWPDGSGCSFLQKRIKYWSLGTPWGCIQFSFLPGSVSGMIEFSEAPGLLSGFSLEHYGLLLKHFLLWLRHWDQKVTTTHLLGRHLQLEIDYLADYSLCIQNKKRKKVFLQPSTALQDSEQSHHVCLRNAYTERFELMFSFLRMWLMWSSVRTWCV